MTIPDEIGQLRAEWALVNQEDPAALKKWFLKYPYINSPIQAMIMQTGLDLARRIKQKAGLRGKMPKNLPPPHKRRISTLTPADIPENWDSKEWLAKAYVKYTARELMEAIGISRRTLYKKYIKYGIKMAHRKTYNPYCNKQWIHEHYVKKQLTQVECAELAGISFRTFARWLIKFDIPARDNIEAFTKDPAKIWVRKLRQDLRKQPTIKKVYRQHNTVHVRFRNYFWESYGPDIQIDIPVFYKISKDDARVEKVPTVIKQFESGIGENEYPAHIIIPKKEWENAKFIERRLALHEFARQIVIRGWIWPFYPQYVIDRELEKLKNSNISEHLTDGIYYTLQYKKHIPGLRILEHFFGLSELYNVLSRPRHAVRYLNILSNRNATFDTHNLFRIVMGHTKYKSINSTFYWLLFKNMGIKGRIMDLTPNYGSRALATAMHGGTYVTEPNPLMNHAIDLGFSDFVGLNYEVDDGSGTFDLVILDDDMCADNIERIFEYAGRAKCLMAFVGSWRRAEFQNKYKPRHVIRVIRRIGSIDYLFVW